MDARGEEFPAIALAVADELETFRRSCESLQELIGRTLRGGGVSPVTLMELYSADVMMQTLQELSKFLRNYAWESERRPDLALESAVSSIVLGSLATRLSGVGAGDRRGAARCRQSDSAAVISYVVAETTKLVARGVDRYVAALNAGRMTQAAQLSLSTVSRPGSLASEFPRRLSVAR